MVPIQQCPLRPPQLKKMSMSLEKKVPWPINYLQNLYTKKTRHGPKKHDYINKGVLGTVDGQYY